MADIKQTFLASIILLTTYTCTRAQQEETFFRKDYKYVEETQSFYKIHPTPRVFTDAARICDAEGSQIFYPENESEAKLVMNVWRKITTQSLMIGVSALQSGTFTTIDGRLILQVYHGWAPGEPNNSGGNEYCVEMFPDALLNDFDCAIERPFVCKKKFSDVQWDYFCDMPELGYTYKRSFGKCFKFHLDPQSWEEANATCSYEQSHLVVINSEEEADFLAELTMDAPRDSIQGDYLRGAVHLGFYLGSQGWTTVKGTKLEDSGYSEWGAGQPDNAGGNEKCGGMFYNGQLNDINCDQKCFFICARDANVFPLMISFKNIK